jgi:signal transduction histidine kinase
MLELEVRDDGRGIAEPDKAKLNSFGIRGMVERAGLLDGRLTVSGVPGEGTTVLLSVPLAPGAGGNPQTGSSGDSML